MRIDIATVLPEIIEGAFTHSIMKRAQEKGLAEVYMHNIRDYTEDKHRRVDDKQYGGGAGMVMTCQPIASLFDKLLSERNYDEVIFMTPDGEPFNQLQANNLSSVKNLLILCGHYKGVDQRIRDQYITKEISVGDFVLSGGELAAAVVGDAIIRLIPGVLNDETSALSDSFQDDLLAPPVYTRPANFKGREVPEVLLSGNDKKIDEWRMNESIARTKARRPDLLKKVD